MPSPYERLMALLAPNPICDDCHEEYDGPVYYSLGDEVCDVHINGITLALDEECTHNFCPTCAGPYLTPDDPDDPRRPAG